VIHLAADGSTMCEVSGFWSPRSVSLDESRGICWVADTYNSEVVQLGADGAELRRIEGFEWPHSVSVNQTDGSCWVADTYNGEVVHLAVDGSELWRGVEPSGPGAVAANPNDGSCWVACGFEDAVVHLAENGAEIWRGVAFSKPSSVSVNPDDGSCWVADTGNNQIVHLSSDGVELWRGGGFSAPTFVLVDQTDGSCWVADHDNFQVVHLAADGTELWRGDGSYQPLCVAISPVDSSCWVSDDFNHRIIRQTQEGTELWERHGFSWPDSVAVDPIDGSCWVADWCNDRLVHLAADGTEIWSGGSFYRPQSVSVNATDGSCWVGAWGSNEIVHFASDGTELSRTIGFSRPQAVSANYADGSCWVADTLNNEVVHLAADGTQLWRGSGFSEPKSVSVDSTDGSCRVADSGNFEVVRVSADGTEIWRVPSSGAPISVSVNPTDGSCWIADYDPYSHACELVHLASDGSELLRRGGCGEVTAVAVNPVDGSCWVADGLNHQVIHFAENGVELSRIGGFSYPESLAVNAEDGSCWVGDYWNSQVVHLSVSGLSPVAVPPRTKVLFPACTAGRPYGPGLFVADGDFSNPVRLTLPEPWPEEGWAPNGCNWGTWSPDGTRVAFTENDRLSILDLAALIRYPGQEPQPLLDEFEQPVEGWNATWSPDSQRLAYHMWGEGQGLYVIDADGTNKRLLVPWPEESYGIRHTRFSPDGSRIAFRQGTWQDNEGHLWVVQDIDDPGGPIVWQLTTDEAYTEIWPFWSPDGSRVAFTRAPRGWTWGEPTADIWVKDLASGTETQITDTPDIFELASGWNPLDGHIYFEHFPADDRTIVSRIRPDGSGREVVADLGDVWPGNEFTWLQTGAWIDGRYALPGETVAPKIGLADAENLAGVQARVAYTGCCNTLSMYGIGLGESILDWVMPSPSIGANSATMLAYAADPSTDAASGALHLFDLGVTNDPAAQPGDTQLLAFDELLLADDWGDPSDRITLDGGVRTIPFANLEVAEITGPAGADLDCPLPFPVTITALDREGAVMTDCNAHVELGGYHMWQSDVLMLDPVTPSSVTLVNGTWSGDVTLATPRCGMQLLAHWEDIGGYSNVFTAISKGDLTADCSITIFDVVKIANMAIGRGAWADWQRWAADLNCDGEFDIFDVIIAANRALEAMQSMGIGRAGAPPVVAPPTEPVTVTTEVTESGGQISVAVKLSNCAGLAGVQVGLEYDAKKLAYSSVSSGELLTGASSWSVMGNDLGGRVKAIAYTPSAEVLSGGEGTILTFTLNQTGKGKAKVNLTSVALADVEGGEITSQTGKGRAKGRR